MDREYLAPGAIVAYGFDNSRDCKGKPIKKAKVVRDLADRWNRKSPYIYSWGREAGDGLGQTGEENPIDWFDRLHEFFFQRCREAAILMVAHARHRHRELMDTTSQQPVLSKAEMRQKAIDLQTLLHYAIESGDKSRLAAAFAAFQAFGEKGLESLSAEVLIPSAELKRQQLEAEREAERQATLARNSLVRAMENGAV